MRREAKLKSALLALQRALQEFHVEYEHYPNPESLKLSGNELAGVLAQFSPPEEPLVNPYSNQPFLIEPNPDRILYQTDPDFLTFSLQALHFTRDEVWFEIDSSSHHSLE
ncbi:MAG: hypothetical protein ACI8UO_000559 [Verrucomicrobiales bacterium]|jgi:hypothetical protein